MVNTSGHRAQMKHLVTILVSSIAATTLAACGGGGGSESWSGASSGTNWNQLSVSGSFDSTNALAIRNSARYQFVDANITLGGVTYTAHPYDLIRLHIARSGGLDGSGQLVAVIDDGFRISHEAFAGTPISNYGDVSVDVGAADRRDDIGHHGTHVASLIAGSGMSGSMVGVVPGASLHLTSYFNDAKTHLDVGKLRLATLHAAGMSAVAQNNSWGLIKSGGGNQELLLSDVQTAIGSTSGTTASVAQAYSTLVGSGAQTWSDYFNALNQFQNSGIIVWALSNRGPYDYSTGTYNASLSLTDADASAALPVLLPYLREAWLAVGNGAYTLDANLRITNATRLSAPCGQAAEFCLFADGTTRAAEALTNTEYYTGTGTSYAAPQVAGAVALVAQAFPNLTPNEWQKRLLASAYSDFTGFTANGNTNFGNGVVRSFSNEWGMGVLDVAAALSPIGTLSLINGRDVHSGERTPLESAVVSTGQAFGDGLARALGGSEIAVFDALNADFYIDAQGLANSDRTGARHSAALPRLTSSGAVDTLSFGDWGYDDMAQSLSFDHLGYEMSFAALGGERHIQKVLGLASENVANASFLSLAGETSSVLGSYDLGFAQFEHFGFVGTHDAAPNGSMTGFGAALAFDFDALDIRLGIAHSAERGAFLGSTSAGAFSLPGQAAINALSFSGSFEVSDRIALFGGMEYGVAHAGPIAGYVTSMTDVTFSGFQLGLRSSDTFTANDRLTFTLSQPMRIEHGSLELSLPIGRETDGTIRYGSSGGTLTPSGRQVDFGVSYGFEPAKDGLYEFGLVYSLDAGHVAGAQAATVAAAYKQRF